MIRLTRLIRHTFVLIAPIAWLAAGIAAQTKTGIDVVLNNGFEQLAGQKVGLITNHTGRSRSGVRTVDLLWQSDAVDLKVLFSPEHGFKGELDRSGIGHSEDEGTGLTIYSLYGDTKKPKPEMVAGLDTLVFDIQDIGCRFYTYISTMGLAMEAAAENGIRFVVLDRPNPIDGVTVSGPMRDPRPAGAKDSFIAWHDLPLRHGMTIGELARMFAAERGIDVDLHVVKMTDWDPQSFWDRTGQPWVDPSPNMRSLKQALLYPGIGLVEGTNVSVGRGTDTPFERMGAPWIRGVDWAAALNGAGLPGVRFVPVEFTPDSSKHKGELCGGVYIMLTDWQRFEPVATGIEVARTLHALYPQAWNTARFNWLLCHQQTADAVLAQKATAAITASWQEELDAFAARRRPFLLYER